MSWLIVLGALLGGVVILGLALVLVKANGTTIKCPKCGGLMELTGQSNDGKGKVVLLYECKKCGYNKDYEEVYNSN